MPYHATYSNGDSKIGLALVDAFSDLCIEEEVSPYDDTAVVIQESRDEVSPTMSF